MSTYFGADSSRFWAMFLGRQSASCPIEDVDEWSTWFQGLLGTPPAPLTLSDGDKQLQQQLLSSKAQPASAFESLNSMFCPDLTDGDDCCVNEVGGCLAELPHRKAADLQGLTCELLSAGVSSVSAQGESCPAVCMPSAWSSVLHILCRMSLFDHLDPLDSHTYHHCCIPARLRRCQNLIRRRHPSTRTATGPFVSTAFLPRCLRG